MAAKKFVYAKRFDGEPKLTDFNLVEEDIPELKDGEILCEAEYLSVDPYMRAYMASYPVGVTMIGSQIAKIIKSKNPKFPVGSYVCGNFGWRSHTVTTPKDDEPYILPDSGDLPRSLGLGALGMPGMTAYFGFLKICQPKEGETVVVTGAAGAVGSLVGQIAKIKKCRVIGVAGTDEKCEWLENELGFDKAINYKTTKNLREAISKAAPNGVDCYFDNVGGEASAAIYTLMNVYGRIAVCGAISGYNGDLMNPVKIPSPSALFVMKQLKMEGFLVNRPEFATKRIEGFKQMFDWIKTGQIKWQETVSVGFDNMPQAFIDMLRGKNTGKAIVQV